MANIANIAATIHGNMCEDDRFGYSWSPRWGTDGYGYATWNIEGRNYSVKIGDYDCSSSTITAWQTALEGTAYEGALDGASYTGNMRDVFVGSGLFDVWDTNSTEAHRGDLYLNDNAHVAMCQYGGQDGTWDSLSEFSINEFGDVYGGETGDQTAWEAHIQGYYDYPWWCTLHYNGKADSGDVEPSPGGGGTDPSGDPPAPVNPVVDEDVPGLDGSGEPVYEAFTAEGGWLGPLRGLKEIDGDSGDDYAGIFGTGIRYLGINGVGKYRVCDLDHGWWPWVDHFDKRDEENGMAGNGSTICAVEIPNDKIKYQVHAINGDWYDWMIGNRDTGGSDDNFAGELGVGIDAIRICKA